VSLYVQQVSSKTMLKQLTILLLKAFLGARQSRGSSNPPHPTPPLLPREISNFRRIGLATRSGGIQTAMS